MSAGAAMIGSAFGPTNPFQAGIALKLAQLPPFAGGGLRVAMFVAGLAVWIAWTVRYAARNRVQVSLSPSHPVCPDSVPGLSPTPTLPLKHVLILILALAPMAVYVYGALRLDWGFNELSGGFLVAGILAGLVGGLGVMGTLTAYLEGAQSLLPAALMIGVARSISMVLDDGHVVDTILNALVTALAQRAGDTQRFLQIAAQALVHVVVPSVSGQAVLTMPLFVPLADLLGMSRQVPVLAYQTGAGLTELVTPTNGALMAVLLAAGVPYERWIRFVTGAALLCVAIGVASIAVAAILWRPVGPTT